MRYSLLNYLSRPKSDDQLVCITVKEVEAPLDPYTHADCSRVSQPGALVGPLPDDLASPHPVAGLLSSLATTPADPSRDLQVEVETGLLVCPFTGRWYPIRDFIPEVLPDHLRNFQQDFEFLRSLQYDLPAGLLNALDNDSHFTQSGFQDEGLKYKQSEMGITETVEDLEEFLLPGYLAPFNRNDTFQTAYFLRLFGFCISMLPTTGTKVVLDTGCGYSWTTEWLMKAGYEVIGLDITRAYLDVGRGRMGQVTPFLIRGDTESLPIRTSTVDAVLGYESFHHIPDRKAAAIQFDRVLRQGGHVLLAEPNGAHEAHSGSQAVMEKFGILERGMELQDVLDYVAGTSFCNVEQIFPLRVPHKAMQSQLTSEFVAAHNWSPGNIFLIDRTPAPPPAPPPSLLNTVLRFLGRS